MNKTLYDVAFVPMNSRLITLSERLAEPLTKQGISVCILKTAFQGNELSGWSDGRQTKIPVIQVKPLWYDEPSNFFKYTTRTVGASKALMANPELPFRLLVVFMDRYAEGGILTAVAKSKGIPTILFQEGFHARMGNYSLSLYDLACWLRSKVLTPWFSSGFDGMQADYVAVWSEYGMKEDLMKRGRPADTIFVVGNPLPPVLQNKKLPSLHTPPVIMIAHQPLNHRYASKSWNDEFYKGAVNILCNIGYNVLFKAHPRCVGDGDLANLRKEIETQISNCSGKMEWVDRNLIAEELLLQCDALITPISITAYTALRMGMPTVFIRTPYNRSPLLEEMGRSGEIIYPLDWQDLGSTLNQVLSNEGMRKHWYNAGPLAANKLSGDSNGFDNKWAECVKKLLSPIG
ncbi:MAG: hypothetical protein WC947_03030 [Elusimicrobiota bacterium]